MTITNIYPANKIGEDMVRQEVEMYLPLQILHNKARYEFLALDRLSGQKSYKIVDTNVGDPQYSKGKPCTMEEQIEAAKIIDADEITLTDMIGFENGEMYPTNESTEMSREAYKKFMYDYARDSSLNLGWVMQAESPEDWNKVLREIIRLPRIETILIPKWPCYTGLWGMSADYVGRWVLTSLIRNREECEGLRHHRIHWLGNGDGFREYLKCPVPGDPQYDVTSSDSGLWIAELAQTGSYDLEYPRPEGFEIDLLYGEFAWTDVERLISDQNKLLAGGNRR